MYICKCVLLCILKYIPCYLEKTDVVCYCGCYCTVPALLVCMLYKFVQVATSSLIPEYFIYPPYHSLYCLKYQ